MLIFLPPRRSWSDHRVGAATAGVQNASSRAIGEVLAGGVSENQTDTTGSQRNAWLDSRESERPGIAKRNPRVREHISKVAGAVQICGLRGDFGSAHHGSGSGVGRDAPWPEYSY